VGVAPLTHPRARADVAADMTDRAAWAVRHARDATASHGGVDGWRALMTYEAERARDPRGRSLAGACVVQRLRRALSPRTLLGHAPLPRDRVVTPDTRVSWAPTGAGVFEKRLPFPSVRYVPPVRSAPRCRACEHARAARPSDVLRDAPEHLALPPPVNEVEVALAHRPFLRYTDFLHNERWAGAAGADAPAADTSPGHERLRVDSAGRWP
jgi:hypothetical protein